MTRPSRESNPAGGGPAIVNDATNEDAAAAAAVVGSTQLYEVDGQIKFVPMPTPDPKDPLNLPQWRKWAALGVLCFFGALAQASEAIVASLLPVFLLEYHGIDPKILGSLNLEVFVPGSTDSGTASAASSIFPPGHEEGPNLSQVTVLSTAPMLISGLACWFLVPASIAVGRRPVMLLAGLLSWAGGIWAACSGGLQSHLAARCVQALGAGTIDSLVPLIVQDMLFIHERNKAMAAVNASTGLIIVTIGITSPIIVVDIGWRWVYGITSIATFASWVGMLFLVPETRWVRSSEELAGQEVYPLSEGETRPQLDHFRYGSRTKRTDFGIFNTKTEWQLAAQSLWLSVKALSFPNVLWCILIVAIFMGAHNAISQVGASLLISAGWQFRALGLAVLPIVIASPFVWFIGGFLADRLSNARARRNGGRREPESHMLSMIFPMLVGFTGPLVYGYVASNFASLPPWNLLLGSGFVNFANPMLQSLVSTYLIECYPNFAGPVLVTLSTFRLVVGYLLSLNATKWVKAIGFFPTFSIYSGLVALAALTLPIIFFFGQPIRAWSGGRLARTTGANPRKDSPQMELQAYTSKESERKTSSPDSMVMPGSAVALGGEGGWQYHEVRGDTRPRTDHEHPGEFITYTSTL